MCVEVPGNVACPTGYQNATQYYTGFSAGGCGGCPGTCTPGSNLCGPASTYGYEDNNCGQSNGTRHGPFTQDHCNTLSSTAGAGPALYSGNATFSVNPDHCSVNQPSANASSLNGVSTVCCM
jgi:hypothetical protein